MTAKQKIDSIECGVDPVSCQQLLYEIHAEMRIMQQHFMKLFYGMLGMIAATMGVKFLGTPWYVHIGGYVVWFTGVFLLSITIGYWQKIRTRQKILSLELSAMMLFSMFVRTFMYEVGKEPPPVYLGIGINFFYVLIAVTLVIISYRNNGNLV